MKPFYKICLLIVIAITASLSIATQISSASTLDCYDINGASIFGWDYDEYIYIGSIANPYNSNSIANSYGSYGSEYASDSIYNEYGTYGGSYGSYSAFNEYASKPPILINDDYEFIGYLTTNDYKSPSIHPWEAYSCASSSFTSANNDHEDIRFSDIPDSTNSYYNDLLMDYYLQQYTESLEEETETLSCSAYENTYLSTDGYCYCNEGYYWSDDLYACTAYTAEDLCYDSTNGYLGDDLGCYCNDGYIWSSEEYLCVEITEDDSEEISTETVFYDLSTTHANTTAILYLYDEGVISGYDDGSFKPENTVNRAELLKILVEGQGITPDEDEYANCFEDVSNDWYAKYVCYAEEMGWVDGYPDGTFKPADTVNKVEALKMLLNSQEISLQEPASRIYDDVATNEWFATYVNTAYNLGILEETSVLFEPDGDMIRAGICENLYRMLTH